MAEVQEKLYTLNEALYEQGHKEGRLKTAKNLLKLNIPIEDIIKSTNLTKKEIESLKD